VGKQIENSQWFIFIVNDKADALWQVELMHRKLRWSILEQCNLFMSRGNRREDIFLDDVDRHDFLEILAEACQKTGWQVHAFCGYTEGKPPRNQPKSLRVKYLVP
jgi:uncharacterized protein YaaQ